MPDTLDQLKQQWQELNLRTTRLEEANRELSERLAKGRTTTVQQTLERETRRWGISGFALILLAFPIWHTLQMPWWMAVIYAAFGALMGILTISLSNFIGRERLVDMPVTQAYERACRIHRYQWYCRGVGIVCGVMVLGCLFYYMWQEDNMYMFAGALLGVFVGLTVGLIKARRQNRMSRQIIKDFTEVNH